MENFIAGDIWKFGDDQHIYLIINNDKNNGIVETINLVQNYNHRNGQRHDWRYGHIQMFGLHRWTKIA